MSDTWDVGHSISAGICHASSPARPSNQGHLKVIHGEFLRSRSRCTQSLKCPTDCCQGQPVCCLAKDATCVIYIAAWPLERDQPHATLPPPPHQDAATCSFFMRPSVPCQRWQDRARQPDACLGSEVTGGAWRGCHEQCQGRGEVASLTLSGVSGRRGRLQVFLEGWGDRGHPGGTWLGQLYPSAFMLKVLPCVI